VHGHPILAGVDKLDQEQCIYGWKPMPFTEYVDLLLSTSQQVDQDEYDNASAAEESIKILHFGFFSTFRFIVVQTGLC